MTKAAQFAGAVTARFAAQPEVIAVALGGSRAATLPDKYSDLDFYVYITEPIPLEARREIARAFDSDPELDTRFGEPGDEWRDKDSGLNADVTYRTPDWIEAQVERVTVRHEASLGYTTCHWHNVRTSTILFDRNGWYGTLQQTLDMPYPEPLRRSIIALNHPILRRTTSSYVRQLEQAVSRRDLVSIQHRITAILASYFDILFAVNLRLHPGQKRLIELAKRQCTKVPPRFDFTIKEMLKAIPSNTTSPVEPTMRLIDGLDDLLYSEGLIV